MGGRRPLLVGSAAGWLDVGVLSGGDSCAARGFFDLWARVDRVSDFALGATLPVQPEPLALPRVVGRAVVGERVRCALGRWRGSPATFTIRWTRPSGREQDLGRGPSYRLSAGDVRRGVTCAVTASNRGGRMTVTAAPLRAHGARARRS